MADTKETSPSQEVEKNNVKKETKNAGAKTPEAKPETKAASGVKASAKKETKGEAKATPKKEAPKAPKTDSKKAPAKTPLKAVKPSKPSQVKGGKEGVRATAKYVRVAPRKARLVIDLIRNKPVDEANQVLQFSTRAVATDVEKVLRSACANAFQNKGLRAEDLVVSQAFVDEGPTIKRIRPRAKGSASRINKRTSHITVVVAPRKEA